MPFIALGLPFMLATTPPLVKYGTCPLGYYSSGAYCVPTTREAPPAIQKVGSCPFGWYSSTPAYCSRTGGQ